MTRNVTEPNEWQRINLYLEQIILIPVAETFAQIPFHISATRNKTLVLLLWRVSGFQKISAC
jgi:hypothetical protein